MTHPILTIIGFVLLAASLVLWLAAVPADRTYRRNCRLMVVAVLVGVAGCMLFASGVTP